MKRFAIVGKTGSSEILVGAKAADVASRLRDRRVIVISDTTVLRLHGDRLQKTPQISIEPGEASKTLQGAQAIYRQLLELEADRQTFLLGVGGGVVTDLTGFVAATFLRGLPFGFLPTTLLAQVDAAIGGKNGVDLKGYKNLVGTIVQPAWVLCDAAFLKTQSAEDFRNGLAEALKAGAIADAELFTTIERHASELLAQEGAVLDEVIKRAVAVKVQIVTQDETEQGSRRLLNFGHTFGHAFEAASGMPHGAAVALGMQVAADISRARGMLSQGECERLRRVIASVGLQNEIPGDPDHALDALRRDKKRMDNGIDCVLLHGIGRATRARIALTELTEVLHDLYEHR